MCSTCGHCSRSHLHAPRQQWQRRGDGHIPSAVFITCVYTLHLQAHGSDLSSTTHIQQSAPGNYTAAGSGPAACKEGSSMHTAGLSPRTPAVARNGLYVDAGLDSHSTAAGHFDCSTPSRRTTLEPRVTLDDALQHSSEQHTVSASAPALRRLKRLSLKTPNHAFSEIPANAGAVLVLYVDSSPIDQAVMSALLNSEPGYKLASASTGRQALDMVLSAEWLPDIILIDVMLPDMKPSDVCNSLRAVYSTVELPVLLLSSRSGEEDMLAALEGGQVNDFLLKPLRRLELMARINSQVGKRAR